LFEEMNQGGSSKKRRWIMIGIGTGLIAIFLVIRNSMKASAPAQVDAANIPAADPQVMDTGGYPDMTGGISGLSGTGLDQTLATYLAVADQNTSVQMGALNNQLTAIQAQYTTSNQALSDQIAAINKQSVTATAAKTPAQPVTTTSPTQTAHPAPSSFTYVIKKGDTLSALATKQYGKQAAYKSGIKEIAAASHISNANTLKAGQTVVIPYHLK
jgi:LysM repeat protein